MARYSELSTRELLDLQAEVQKQYDEIKGYGLKLDMSRGKPSTKQLDLSEGMLGAVLTNEDCYAQDGTDCRNYGVLKGIPEARKLMGDIMGVPAENVIVCGNASLSIMFDNIARSWIHGICGNTPWSQLDRVKFLCPVPGYDRHFAITEHFGIEMVNIPMTPTGPDMDLVEQYVNNDEAVKGIWCVPKYSNPQGITYSDETVKRFAALKPAAADFRIYWDNAYCLHDLVDNPEDGEDLLDILSECANAGNPDIVFLYASTSKISFAGGGIAAIASSEANLKDFANSMQFKIISYDKMNMLRHVRYFRDLDGVRRQMKRHAELMRENFNLVDGILKEELGGTGCGTWNNPKGGYFISFDALPGCARDIIGKAKEAGLVMTGAGSTFPYHHDPEDKNIRIAPSVPTYEELEKAAKLFTICVKLVSINKILSNRKD